MNDDAANFSILSQVQDPCGKGPLFESEYIVIFINELTSTGIAESLWHLQKPVHEVQLFEKSGKLERLVKALDLKWAARRKWKKTAFNILVPSFFLSFWQPLLSVIIGLNYF